MQQQQQKFMHSFSADLLQDMDSHFYKNTSKKKKTAAYRIHVYKL
jgi:hypothetical protein